MHVVIKILGEVSSALKGVIMKFELRSKAFDINSPIPRRYTGEGDDISPSMEWQNLPEGTKELALVCDDPDAPTVQPFVHWLIYKLNPSLNGLPEGVSRGERPYEVRGAVQGLNSFDRIGYGGPMPPEGHGVHRYHFKLYALDKELPDKPGMDKIQLIKEMEGHILKKTELVGTYKR